MPVGTSRLLKQQNDRSIGKFSIEKIQHAINIVGFDPQSKDSFLRLFNFLSDKKESLKERTRSKNLLRQCLEKFLRCDLKKLNSNIEKRKGVEGGSATSQLFIGRTSNIRDNDDFAGGQLMGKYLL